jgi:hypothetical protein
VDRIIWNYALRSEVLASVLFLIVSPILTPCSGDPTFERTYGGDSWDFGGCVRQTLDRGYVVVEETHRALEPGVRRWRSASVWCLLPEASLQRQEANDC